MANLSSWAWPSADPPENGLGFLSQTSSMFQSQSASPRALLGDAERMTVHKSILVREKLLQTAPRDLVEWATTLRRTTLQLVEEITAWRKAMNSTSGSLAMPSILSFTDAPSLPSSSSPPLPFMHCGSNYLLKVRKKRENCTRVPARCSGLCPVARLAGLTIIASPRSPRCCMTWTRFLRGCSRLEVRMVRGAKR